MKEGVPKTADIGQMIQEGQTTTGVLLTEIVNDKTIEFDLMKIDHIIVIRRAKIVHDIEKIITTSRIISDRIYKQTTQ